MFPAFHDLGGMLALCAARSSWALQVAPAHAASAGGERTSMMSWAVSGSMTSSPPVQSATCRQPASSCATSPCPPMTRTGTGCCCCGRGRGISTCSTHTLAWTSAAMAWLARLPARQQLVCTAQTRSARQLSSTCWLPAPSGRQCTEPIASLAPSWERTFIWAKSTGGPVGGCSLSILYALQTQRRGHAQHAGPGVDGTGDLGRRQAHILQERRPGWTDNACWQLMAGAHHCVTSGSASLDSAMALKRSTLW